MACMITHSNVYYPHRPIALRDDSARSPGTKISDAALIAAVARGDQQAMRRLYERYSVHVYRFAGSLGIDHSAAEGLVSEVFLEVWRCAGAFEGRAQASTWLLAITGTRRWTLFGRSNGSTTWRLRASRTRRMAPKLLPRKSRPPRF
jgi:hypothetical protein